MRAAKTTIVYIWFYFMLLFNWKLRIIYVYTEPNWKGQCSAIDFPQTNVTIHQVRTIWVQRQKQLLPYGYHIMFISNRKLWIYIAHCTFSITVMVMSARYVYETNIIPTKTFQISRQIYISIQIKSMQIPAYYRYCC